MEEGREADVTWRSGRVRNGSLEPSDLLSRLPDSRKDFDLAGRNPGFSSGTPIKKAPLGGGKSAAITFAWVTHFKDVFQ